MRSQPLTIGQLNQIVKDRVQSQGHSIIASLNLHGIYLFHYDAGVRSFYGLSDYIHVDGMPILFWARLLGYPVTRDQRVTFVDWVMPLVKEAWLNGWRIFYLGSKPGVAKRGADILRERFEGLEILTSHGYFDISAYTKENQQVLSAINDYKPNILMVGMGMPRQEYWILNNFMRVNANVFLNCGACMDYIAGVARTPPRWAGRLGLEGFCRLLWEPRRLWRRCLWEPWFLLRPMVQDIRDGHDAPSGVRSHGGDIP